MVCSNRLLSLRFKTSRISPKVISQSKTFASRPRRVGEWASEFDINVRLSSVDSRQFMGGSLDRPVSTAKM